MKKSFLALMIAGAICSSFSPLPAKSTRLTAQKPAAVVSGSYNDGTYVYTFSAPETTLPYMVNQLTVTRISPLRTVTVTNYQIWVAPWTSPYWLIETGSFVNMVDNGTPVTRSLNGQFIPQ